MKLADVNSTFDTSQGRDVKDTKMLKGVAQNSLFGKNVTKQDVRSYTPSGPFGGTAKPGGGGNKS